MKTTKGYEYMIKAHMAAEGFGPDPGAWTYQEIERGLGDTVLAGFCISLAKRMKRQAKKGKAS